MPRSQLGRAVVQSAGCFQQGQRLLIEKRRCSSSSSDDSYQFLQRSVIPSFHFQKSLRRLPIPKLEMSCARYLAAIQPITTSEQFNATTKIVDAFVRSPGPDLQQQLLAYDKAHRDTSFISEPWFDMYLRSRLPCPVHFNPFMTFAPDPDQAYNDQLTRATNFVISFGRFKRSLDANILAPEVFHLNPKKSDTKFFNRVMAALPESVAWFGAVAFKAFPLDMSQYKSLFGGSRIPQPEKDRLFHDPDSKHMLVIHKGSLYSVQLFDETGKLLPPETVHACLHHILHSSRPSKTTNLGAFTSLDRDSWASLRTRILPGNERAFASVDSALFALCLDETDSNDPQRLIQSLLIGDDASNRWFDKCFQLIVDRRGTATINFEHSWGDGVAVLRLMEESLRDTNAHHFVQPNQKPSPNVDVETLCKPIDFSLDVQLKSEIVKAQEKHTTASSKLAFATLEYKNMTRDSIKRCKLSPDAVMQLAIQLAFYRQYGSFVPTYESCSTAAFLKGRTECMRSATSASRDAVLALAKQDMPNDTRARIQKAAEVHTQLVKEASMGQGFDRHLLGLRITAERAKMPPPLLFTDPVYQYVNEFVLSTSTLSTETIFFGGFGPVVPQGFGIGYNVVASKLGAVISAYKKERDAQGFATSMSESLDLIKKVIEKAP